MASTMLKFVITVSLLCIPIVHAQYMRTHSTAETRRAALNGVLAAFNCGGYVCGIHA